MRPAVWFESESEGSFSEAENTTTSRPSGHGEARDYGVEDGGSSYFQGSGREGDAGRGSKADGLPRAHAAAMEYQVRENRISATAKAR